MLCTIVTCMGRLAHLKASLPTFPRPCLVVSYSCPDGSGKWARSQGAQAIIATGAKFFHKTLAQNMGAREAYLQAEWVSFLDADTLVQPGFVEWVTPRLQEGTCLIGPKGEDTLVGVLVVHKNDFYKAGGFNEAYEGWGVEDIGMRLSLRLLAGCTFERIPAGLLKSIPHGDALRTANYAIKNQWISRARNAMILEHNIRDWTGKGLTDLDADTQELFKV